MIYSVGLGLLAAIALKRNPLSILTHVTFKVPYVMIGSLLIQAGLEYMVMNGSEPYPVILNLTFAGMIISLFLNRHISGINWIFWGTVFNLSALVLHGGLMPVSEHALQVAGLEELGFQTDSRHQVMESSLFWWLGDWIPVFTPVGTNYVYSPGDVLVDVGMFLFIVRNAVRRGQSR